MYASLSRMQYRAATNLIALTTVLSQSVGELVIVPKSTESKVGDTIYFNCSTNLTSEEIFWHHDLHYIYAESGFLEPYHERFEIDRNASNGSHNLIIHSVQPSDAGKYICIDEDGHGAKRSAELVVLDNDPECQSNIHPEGVIGQNSFNITPDEFQLTCTVTYKGSISPQLEWKRVGEKSPIRDNSTSVATSTNRSISTLKLKGDISLDNASYVCQTKRSTQNQYKCTSEIIKVLYFIGRNFTEQSVVRGDKIACIASSTTFPCIRQWYHANNSCPLLCDETITAHLLGEYRCAMKCHLRGKDHFFNVTKAVVVEATQPPPPSYSGAIAAAVVVPILILVVSIPICVILYKQRKNARRDLKKLKIKEEEIELLHKIKKASSVEENPILGLAMLGDLLYLVRERTAGLEFYNCNETTLVRHPIKLNDLVAAADICSCKEINCLYIMDKKDGRTPKEILKFNINEESPKKWPTKDNVEGYLSATTDGNVIVTVQDKGMLLEYTADGEWVRDIALPRCCNLWHAIKLKNEHYIVSHGTLFDPVHRVCLVDKEGHIEKEFGREFGPAEDQLYMPYYLTVGGSFKQSTGCVIVADLINNRVLLLDSNLKFKASIVPKFKQRFRNPRRVFLDERRLVVAITAGDPKEIVADEVIEHNEAAGQGGTSSESKELMETENTGGEKIEEDCRVLVFDVQPLLQKFHNC